MTLVPLPELLHQHVGDGAALAAFNVVQVEHAEAYALAAELAELPVVMQISQSAVRYHGRLEPIASATLAIARGCTQPVAVHLDHANDEELLDQALALGFGSVMLDSSRLAAADYLKAVERLVERAHAVGVGVEAELGDVGGLSTGHPVSARTDPLEAERFVQRTGVDVLAVAVGNTHAMVQRSARLDHALIEELARRLPATLALHGSSGVPDESLVTAALAGIRKISITTQVNRVFTHAVQDYLLRDPTVDTRRYFSAARDAAASEAGRLMLLLARPDAPAQ